MKKKLTKAEYDALSPAMQALYEADGAGYKLPLEDDTDADAVESMKRAKTQEADKRKEAEQKLRDLLAANAAEAETRRKEAEEAAKKTGDIATLEKGWQEKVTAAEDAGKAQAEALTKQLHTLLVDNVATSMAAEISTVPGMFAGEISKRLKVEVIDGIPQTRVVDKDGKLSALTLDDLKKELTDDERYAPIIIASKGNGSGASGAKGRSGGKTFSEMNEAEKTELYNRDSKEFDRLQAASAQKV